MTTTFDTSGAVGEMPGWRTPVPSCNRFMRWSDLSPFTQGYIEALFASVVDGSTALGNVLAALDNGTTLAFRHLAPETLARIIADCEAFVADRAGFESHHMAPTYQALGAKFWKARQSMEWGHPRRGPIKWALLFPPLTVQLDDDGKVRFSERG